MRRHAQEQGRFLLRRQIFVRIVISHLPGDWYIQKKHCSPDFFWRFPGIGNPSLFNSLNTSKRVPHIAIVATVPVPTC